MLVFIRAILVAALAAIVPSYAQQSSPASGGGEILRQIQELREALKEVRQELEDSRRETRALRRELENVQGALSARGSTIDGAVEAVPPAAGLARLKEDQDLLAERVAEHEQTKVESGSKYRVRVSGMALINIANNVGTVDHTDMPTRALSPGAGESGGTFAATARQTFFRLEVFGPKVAGAATRGEASFDFFGGFPYTPEAVTAGLVRMRTASITLDWKNTSLFAGQEAPFISPLSPTSLAMVAYPALSGAGNLWVWTPQARVERRFAISDTSRLSIQAGVMDPLSGEYLGYVYNRVPYAGERSRIPAFAARIGWQGEAAGRTASIGAGGYYSRQDWKFGRQNDAWAATADWDVPIGQHWSLSGEFYRGRAIAGLGGSATGSVLFSANPTLPASSVIPLDSAGGWAQLKFKPVERLEFNWVFGEDYSYRKHLSYFYTTDYVRGSGSSRNASGFVNAIFQLRSNVLLSLEYRKLWTTGFGVPKLRADHVNIGGGIVF